MDMQLTDQEIIQRCLQGEMESFNELVVRYKKLIFSVVYKYLKDWEETNDVSQEVFIRIYRSLGTYDPQFKFSSWAARIAVNLCLDILRKKKINSVPMEDIEKVSRENDTPETRYINRERSRAIRKAVAELPEKYRTPILLYHQKGLSYKEIADVLKKPISIVKNRLYRARLILRESIEV